MRITAELLTEHRVCKEQVALFREVFPEGTTTSKANLLKAAKAGLLIGWLGQFVPATAKAEYTKAIAPAWAEYTKVSAPAWAEYDRVRAAAWAEYTKVSAPALARALRGAKA